MVRITVLLKSMVKLKPTIVEQTIELANKPDDVHGFIEEVVTACVKAYEERAENQVLNVLSCEEIENAAATGKVGFGVHYSTKKPNLAKAKANAIQSFEDGIFCIFSGDRRLESLDETVDYNKPFTFVRLTMLCGRMW